MLIPFQTDPRHTVGSLSEREVKLYRNQSIPTLYEVLNEVKLHNTVVMFTISSPPSWHPFHDSMVDEVLKVINDSGISHSQVSISVYTDDESLQK